MTNTVFGSFPGYGVYEFAQNTWRQASPSLTTVLGNGSVPTVISGPTPGGAGVSEWNGVSWSLLTNGLSGTYNPVVLASNASGDAVATFAGTSGVWFWNGTIWTQIDTRNASVLALLNTNTVVADFAGTGVWEYNGSSWSNIKTIDATLLGIGNGGVIVANLSTTGVCDYNGSSWAADEHPERGCPDHCLRHQCNRG